MKCGRHNLAFLLLLTTPCFAGEIDVTFFEKNIRPVLIESCYECHSVEAGKSKAGLLLDTREGTQPGGDNGPAVVPGDPEVSLLYVAITHAESDLEMPPKKAKLPDTVIDDFRRWIEGGAPDPRDEPRGKLTDAPIDYESGREFWAWQMPQWPDISESKFQSEWARSDIDRLVLSGLEKANLQPSEVA